MLHRRSPVSWLSALLLSLVAWTDVTGARADAPSPVEIGNAPVRTDNSDAPLGIGTSNAPLRIDASAERMRVDGALKEWKGARFATLGQGDDASLRYALATADGGLYVAAEVRDDRLLTGDQGDALVVALQMPDGEKLHLSELWLSPGQAGRAKAYARLSIDGRAAKLEPRVQVVEGPLNGAAGYVLEAYIPWAAVRSAEIWEQGRAQLRLVDVDDNGDRTTFVTAQAVDGTLPRIVLGSGNRDRLGSFLQDRKLIGVEPRYDFRANVSGDERPERVAIIDQYVVVYGPGFKNGETYNYFTLPYSLGGGLIDAKLVDLTNDGRAELAVRVRQQNAVGTRELWLALALDEHNMEALLTVELKKQVKGGSIESTLSIAPAQKGAAPRIEVATGRANGLDARTYREAPAADATPILLPWGDVEQRSYAWDGKQFQVFDEKRRAVTPSAVATTPAARTSKTEAAPTITDEGDKADVLAAYRAQAKLPDSARPTRTLHVNMLGSSASERVDLFGATLVFSGPDIGAGHGYLTYAAPVSTARDVVDVQSADVTADSVDELLVRIEQDLTGAGGVRRQLLLVLRGDASGRIARALVVEVARRQRDVSGKAVKSADGKGERAIENLVQLQKGALTIAPGSARGWTEQTYPFTSEPIAGSEPLLLPWADQPVRYRLQGASLVPMR